MVVCALLARRHPGTHAAIGIGDRHLACGAGIQL